ncbi:MAG: hypothetical protein QW186_08555 [Candidatus Bathyarchaeia archaeon]|nr:hypothetical protein [Candidatus Bathyarchaeota archaeon]
MPVRVRVKIKGLKGLRAGSAIETSALLNTGYTGASPEIIVPVRLAERLGLWPPPSNAIESTYDTAGGPARFYVIREAATLQIVGEDLPPRELIVDIVISPLEREVLLSDYVIGELEIIILNAYRGAWRLQSDPPEKMRYSERPELW